MSECERRGPGCAECPTRDSCEQAVDDCKPGSSACAGCPAAASCASAAGGSVARPPYPKTPPPKDNGADCPNAGTDKCSTCPSRSQCAAGEFEHVKRNLASISHKIVVLSGKGGVGKSTFTAQLAYSLAVLKKRVGVLDVDICGPSIPKLFGVDGSEVVAYGDGWCPVRGNSEVAVMSSGFLLEHGDDPIIWRGPRKNALIQKYLTDVIWSGVDWLLVDTPPGTGDEHITLGQLLNAATFDGVVILTTPQEVSLLDVKKEIDFCRKLGIEILGVVENMSLFVCPKCQTRTPIFAPTTGGARKMCIDFGVRYLGAIPLDPRMVMATDEGKSISQVAPESAAAASMADATAEILRLIEAAKAKS